MRARGNSKVDNYDQLLEQIQLFREQGMGNYRELLMTVAKNPTMIFWLDNNQNHGTAVNENWGRELLELFSLGGPWKSYDVIPMTSNYLARYTSEPNAAHAALLARGHYLARTSGNIIPFFRYLRIAKRWQLNKPTLPHWWVCYP